MQTNPIIRILGAPDIWPKHRLIFFPSKAYQLITLLARAPAHRLARKEAASLLWDSEIESAGLSNLRQLIARIKKAVVGCDGLLQIDAFSIGLGEGKSVVDLCRFEEQSRNQNPADAIAAIALFRGDLLESLDDATDTFSHWLIRERAAVRERFFASASATLIDLTRYGRASAGDLDFIARKMLALEPEREQTYRVLIEAYGRNGMFDDASRIYRELCVMLEREHSAQPSPETAAVARRVFASRAQYRPLDLAAQASGDQPRVAFLALSSFSASEPSTLVKLLLEDIANELCRHRTFTVLALHSSLKVPHDLGIPADNSILRADYSISGFIKPDSNGTMLALRMVDVSSQEMIWSGEFSISEAALLKAFSTLSLRVASSLGAAIENERLARLRKNVDSHAYLHYLEGQQWLANCDLPRLRRARKSFRQAVDADPRFAPPRARIAQTLYLEWIQLGGRDPDLLNVAREQSEIALALDPNDAIGHWMKGTVALYQRDFEECELKLAEAEALCPNSADLQVQCGDALSHMGDPDGGWGKFERAIDLNPLPPDHYWWAGASIAFHQRAFQKTIDLCGKLADDEPVLSMLAASHALIGDLDRARVYGSRIKDLFPGGLALEKSATVTPDRLDDHRQLRLEGLRLAGAI